MFHLAGLAKKRQKNRAGLAKKWQKIWAGLEKKSKKREALATQIPALFFWCLPAMAHPAGIGALIVQELKKYDQEITRVQEAGHELMAAELPLEKLDFPQALRAQLAAMGRSCTAKGVFSSHRAIAMFMFPSLSGQSDWIQRWVGLEGMGKRSRPHLPKGQKKGRGM